MAQETGAQSCIRALHAAGVDVCFANPGTTEMWLVAGLDAVPGVRSVLGLHETVCTGAADGYSRMKRGPAATLLHLGPGLANGIANLHNARRARSAVISMVGDMSSWHGAKHDSSLCMDIASLAATVGTVISCGPEPDQVAHHVAHAVAATTVPASALASRVATLILPHDTTWTMTAVMPDEQLAALTKDAKASASKGKDALHGPEADAFFVDCAAALRASAPGTAGVLLGGDATLADRGALHIAGAIAAATGAVLLCENGFARVDRGAGLPALTRLPYFPRDAAKALSAFTSCLVLIDAKAPCPMFGYAVGPRDVVTLSEDAIWDIDAPDAVAALLKLAAALGIPQAALKQLQPSPPHAAPRELSPELRAARDAALTPPLLCAVVAALQPADAIIVDEALTTGTDYWARSATSPAFSHLTLTGGAIGQGPPTAVGAAVACPARRVINIQADGSGMYSPQALWTQARENLDVVTIVCANRKYNILKIELALQRVNCSASTGVAKSLTDLGEPAVDWVSLAKGLGVTHAERASTVGQLADQLAAALQRKGPTVIEAVLP